MNRETKRKRNVLEDKYIHIYIYILHELVCILEYVLARVHVRACASVLSSTYIYSCMI